MSDQIIKSSDQFMNIPQKRFIPDLNISIYDGDLGGSGCVDAQQSIDLNDSGFEDTKQSIDLNDDPPLLLEDRLSKSKVGNSSKFSNKQRLDVRCLSEGCEWFLRSRSIKDTEAFTITSFNDVHTCSKTESHPHHRNANKKVVAHFIKDLIDDNPRNLKGKDVVNIIGQRFISKLSYKQGWKGKVYAERLRIGSSEDSFDKLPIYCHNLEIANPGTRAHILRDDLNRFEMLFIAIGVSIRSFIKCLRLMIIIDGAHLKGSFKGTMFLAVGMDGNNKIFPIAYGVGKRESGESWTWFLTKLRECVGDQPNLAIISNRAKSIELAVKNAFSLAYHGFCCQHLMVNLRLKGKA
ncbi:uncharacterized protein LOC143546383 [Bidens hawaiensis]|uniref:uncharacterized protein LOC143546383 n=1 Tax=Bidens hawaiensis TaxID=980011 RepID=UPI00404B7B53